MVSFNDSGNLPSKTKSPANHRPMEESGLLIKIGSGQLIIFHQPRFLETKGSSLPQSYIFQGEVGRLTSLAMFDQIRFLRWMWIIPGPGLILPPPEYLKDSHLPAALIVDPSTSQFAQVPWFEASSCGRAAQVGFPAAAASETNMDEIVPWKSQWVGRWNLLGGPGRIFRQPGLC